MGSRLRWLAGGESRFWAGGFFLCGSDDIDGQTRILLSLSLSQARPGNRHCAWQRLAVRVTVCDNLVFDGETGRSPVPHHLHLMCSGDLGGLFCAACWRLSRMCAFVLCGRGRYRVCVVLPSVSAALAASARAGGRDTRSGARGGGEKSINTRDRHRCRATCTGASCAREC